MATFISNGTPITEPSPQYDIPLVSNNGVLKARHQSGLPLGYTLLEYIEFTGAQYIDTGINPTSATEIEMKILAGSGMAYSTAGSASSSKGMYWLLGSQASANMNAKVTNFTTTSGTKYTIIQNRNNVILNGTTISYNGSVADFTGTNPLWISGGPSFYYRGRVYSWIVRENNTVVQHLVPVKTVVNGQTVVGMFDTVTGNFLTNSGTGDFVAGTAVSDPVEIYTDGTVETIEDTIGNTATTEMLLKVGDYQDVQSIIDGVVTRNVGVAVLDGSETVVKSVSTAAPLGYYFGVINTNAPHIVDSDGYCSHFANTNNSASALSDGTFAFGSSRRIWFATSKFTEASDFQQWLAAQYAAGTPVIIVYPLAEPTTETVAGQALQVQSGDNVLEITQASLTGLELEAQYQAAVSLTIQEVEDANLDNNVEVTIS